MKLALGCGDNFLGEEWVHLDISDLAHVDVVHDLESGELPFNSNRFDKVRAVHVLEHLSKDSLISVLEEVSRVAKPGAEIFFVLPHFLSWNAADLDHYRGGSKKTFVQFCKGYEMNSPYPVLFEDEEIEYVFINRLPVQLSRFFLGGRRTAMYLPNAVREIRYQFRNL